MSPCPACGGMGSWDISKLGVLETEALACPTCNGTGDTDRKEDSRIADIRRRIERLEGSVDKLRAMREALAMLRYEIRGRMEGQFVSRQWLLEALDKMLEDA